MLGDKLRVIGFEPDVEECAKLNAAAAAEGLNAQFIPTLLGDKIGDTVFYDNLTPGGGSMLRQNRRVTDRWKFQNPDGRQASGSAIFYPTGARQAPVTTLDTLPRYDLLKMNVQGGEMMVLDGARASLATCLGVFTEVGFVESYCGRPMFSDIDVRLRREGFTLFDFWKDHHVGRAASAFTVAHSDLNERVPRGQLIECDAVYLRDPLDGTRQFTVQELYKLCVIAEIFGQIEYALELLGLYDKDTAAQAADQYRRHGWK